MTEKYLSCKGGLVEDNCIVTADLDTWELYKYDFSNNKLILSASLEDSYSSIFWCQRILHVDDSYYFLYRNCMRIKEYNVVTKQIHDYGYDKELGEGADLRYMSAYSFDKEIVMLPGKLDGDIWRFDTDTKNFSLVGKLFEITGIELEPKISGTDITYSQYQDKYWFALKDTKILGYINTGFTDCGYINIDSHEPISASLCCDIQPTAGGIIIVDNGDNIYVYNGERLQKLNMVFSDNGDKIFTMFFYNKRFYVIRESVKCIEKYFENGDMDKIIELPSEYEKKPEVRRYHIPYTFPIIYYGKCYFLPFSANGILVLDLAKDTFEFFKTEIGIEAFVISLVEKA